MNKMGGAVKELYRMDELAARDTWLNRLHPLTKLLATLFYIIITVSFSRYQLSSVLLMAVYPVVLFIIGDISFSYSIRRLWIVLPLVCLVGIFNPFFDRQPVYYIRGLLITAGMISMATLMLKGILCILASYLFIASTNIESICYALRMLHLPSILVTQILLTYRYLSLLLSEAGKLADAYSLRAPGQKGIYIKAWGSLAGGLLLRSMDRASALYESMVMRGYTGEFYYGQKKRLRKQDITYLLVWTAVFAAIKYF
ncbi:cobalt ECF transporter T component CbiQ [Faecalicatena contorta]|uniref:cobalt ECF transporter T component CbiQ n=1 Tax=Faecalicatena contorta TaxID=39482 RepID=UPI001F47A0EF|nr:cobalt ECF transporter T component CbiQ [Faecalicatena contorta]MCF2682516.1 cobalt ECF transporter T component CbiQ [Faecalicatena contorta]